MYGNQAQRSVQRFAFTFGRLPLRNTYFVGLAAVIVLAITGAVTLNAKPPTDLSWKVEQAIKRTDERSKAADLMGVRIAHLEERLDERVASLQKDLESVQRHVALEDGLIAATNARLDAQSPLPQFASFENIPMSEVDKSQERSAQQSPETRVQKITRAGQPLQKQSGSVPRVPHLGIELSYVTLDGSAATRRLMIVIVDPGSSAERAGVQRRDLLLKVAGVPVSSPDQVYKALLPLKGQRHVILTLRRDGKTQFANLRFG
jgi:C-terminal processing protease CtpA/Prc